MVRIRVGKSWKHNPAYVRGLKALAEGRSRGFSPRDIVDVLGIEVDGVDLAQGLAEAALFDAMSELVRAARSLASSDGEERVALAKAPVELRLSRQGDELFVSLRALDRGQPVAREAVVDPARFFEAVRGAAKEFLDDLAAIHPALGELRVVRTLGRESVRAPSRRPVRRPKEPQPERIGLANVGDYALTASEGPNGLAYVDVDDRRLWFAPGTAKEGLEVLHAALRGEGEWPVGARLVPGTREVVFGRAPPVPKSEVAGAVGFLLGTLGDRRAEPPAQIDLLPPEPPAPEPLPASRRRLKAVRAPGMPAEGLRRLILRPSWRSDAPGQRPRLTTAAGLVVVRTQTQVEARRTDGERAWTLPLHEALAVGDETRSIVVGREAPGVFVVVDAKTGERLGRTRAPLERPLTQAMLLDGGLVAVTDGTRVHGLEPARSKRAWAFDAGPDRTLQLAGAWSGLVAATDAGDVYGLHPTGTVAFRAAGTVAHLQGVRLAVGARLAVVSGLDHEGQAMLAAVSLDDGRVAWRHAFPGLRPSAPLVVGARVALGFETQAGPTLAVVDLKSGRARRQSLVPGDGAAVPFDAGGRVGVARVGGGLCLFDTDGRLVVETPSRDPDPALSPVKSRPVLTGAGLVVVASALVHVFDAQEGRPLASFEPAELAPESLALLDGPMIVAAGREGIVDAWRAFGHLRLVA